MPSDETNKKLKLSESASINDEESLEPRLQDPGRSSVYDFMYHDARRVASFISQFQDYGVLTSVKAEVGAETTGTTIGSVGASGGIPLVGQATGNLSHNNAKKEADKLEQSFDPLWRTAIHFLDYLASEELIVNRAEDARIGQFVRVTGSLAVFDMNNMQIAWKTKLIREAALNNFIANIHRNPLHNAKQHKDHVTAIFDFLKDLPHVVQMGIKTPENFFWGILSEVNLVTSSTDILLKSGGSLSGHWTVIGIIDSIPDDMNNQAGDTLGQLGAFGELASGLAPVIRAAVGRPSAAYGITPLLILREVSGSTQTA